MARWLNLTEILTCGLLVVAVVTQTVNVWSAADSVGQDDIFDLKFRTERLIIQSRYPVITGYSHYPDTKWIPFGPIFHLYLLNQVQKVLNTFHFSFRVQLNISGADGFVAVELRFNIVYG